MGAASAALRRPESGLHVLKPAAIQGPNGGVMSQPLVLIVDDNPDNLNIVGELLAPRHAVRVANGGWRGLQLARMAPLPAPPRLSFIHISPNPRIGGKWVNPSVLKRCTRPPS